MIQRIQSVYFLAIVVLSIITLLSPMVDLYNQVDMSIYLLNYKGVYLINPAGNIYHSNVIWLTIIAAMVPLISLFTIFLYKKRIAQIRFSIINMFLMAGFYALLFIYIWFAGQNLHTDWSLHLTTSFPLINIVLNFLAIRAIGKDDALIKSVNRIR